MSFFLQTQVQTKKMSLSEVTHQLVDMIVQRAKQGMYYICFLVDECSVVITFMEFLAWD